MELQRSQSNMDLSSCEVIQHLLGVTKTVACTIPEEGTNAKVSENKDSNYNESKGDGAKSYDDDDYPKKPKDTCSAPRLVNLASYSFGNCFFII